MAIAFVVEWFGTSEAQYHTLRQALAADGQLAPGEICHIPKDAEHGWRFVDVWESEGAFRSFFAGRLDGLLGAVGLPPPQVRPWPSYEPPAAIPTRTCRRTNGVERPTEPLRAVGY